MASFNFTRLTRAVEIGANAYQLEVGGRRIILDCGLHPRFGGNLGLPQFDLVPDGEVDAVVITHAHQDHIGSLPVLQRRQPQAKVFLTEATRQLSDIMLHNSVNVMYREKEQGSVDPVLFGHREVDHGMKQWISTPVETRFDLTGERLGPEDDDGVSLEFFDAGHILGSVGVRIRAEGRTVFYTGDVQFNDQTLSRAAIFPEEPVDVLIMECTRGDHAIDPGYTREAEEMRFVRSLQEVFSGGGGVLVPTFALGKTQELLAMCYELRRKGLLRVDCPIYIGGLGAKLTEVHDRLAGQTRRQHPNLRLADEVAPFVIAGQSAADTPMKSRRIYALSSGMMSEHTVSNIFARKVLGAPEHALFFIGYCDPETPGGFIQHAKPGDLIELAPNTEPVPLNCRVEKFDLSGHATRENLRTYVNKVRPKKVLLVHGSPEAANWFHETISADIPGCQVLIPEPGVTLEI
jgi:Cft2 family RNA processing exonuclease